MKIKTKRLTFKQEREYLDDPNISDADKRSRLVLDNIGLVYSAAHKYTMGHDLEDLISEGTLGLAIAAQRFDITLNKKFCKYAPHWIKKRIIEYKTSQFKSDHLSDDNKSHTCSLDFSVTDDNIISLGDVMEDINYDSYVERNDSYEVLMELLGSTRKEYREIILLHVIEGKTFKEIAKILGRRLSIVAYHYRKGIKVLKNELIKKGIHSLDYIL